jgi:hypothetical protein
LGILDDSVRTRNWGSQNIENWILRDPILDQSERERKRERGFWTATASGGLVTLVKQSCGLRGGVAGGLSNMKRPRSFLERYAIGK